MRRFQPSDLPELNSWYENRGLPPLDGCVLSTIGLIEPGVAALFLYGTDSSVAMLEGLVTNAQAEPTARNRAINEMIIKLLDQARELGFTKVIGLTQDPGTFKRVQQLGFRDLGLYHMVVFGA
jgi:hypothetical protein